MTANVTSTPNLGGHYYERGEALRGEDGDLLKDENGHSVYAEKADRVEYQFGRNIASDPTDRQAVAKEMQATAQANPRVKNRYHKSTLSLHPSEHLTEAEWRDVSDRYLSKMDDEKGRSLADRKSWIVVHKDRDHQHAHIITNRVDDDGKCWDDGHNYARAETAMREIEHEFDLYKVQGTKGKWAGNKVPTDVPSQKENGPPTAGQATPRGARKMYDRTGEVPFSKMVEIRRDDIKKDLHESTSLDDANRRLSRYGMEIRKTKRGGVIAEADAPTGTNKAKGLSSIDRASSLPKLTDRWSRERDRNPNGKASEAAREAGRGR